MLYNTHRRAWTECGEIAGSVDNAEVDVCAGQVGKLVSTTLLPADHVGYHVVQAHVELIEALHSVACKVITD